MVFLRRLLTLIVGSALLAQLVAFLRGRQEQRRPPEPLRAVPAPSALAPATEPTPIPTAPEPEPIPVVTDTPWVEPVDDDAPDGYPVKVKVSSGIYHEPGGTHYTRVKPDRCYTNAAAAEADGFRASKS